VTISGWLGIVITKDKKKDMIWPDMLWFWVLAYDLWNFAYGYNCVGDQSFYSGLCLLAAATIPALTWRKGAYLQHRAQTLAFWMTLCMSLSYISTIGWWKQSIFSSSCETSRAGATGSRT
jgi:hypothetical protein